MEGEEGWWKELRNYKEMYEGRGGAGADITVIGSTRAQQVSTIDHQLLSSPTCMCSSSRHKKEEVVAL